jgi:hypothetical protein
VVATVTHNTTSTPGEVFILHNQLSREENATIFRLCTGYKRFKYHLFNTFGDKKHLMSGCGTCKIVAECMLQRYTVTEKT